MFFPVISILILIVLAVGKSNLDPFIISSLFICAYLIDLGLELLAEYLPRD